MNISMLERARQQMIGFSHANSGGGFPGLIEAMGMSPEEWKELLHDPCVTVDMLDEGDEHFSGLLNP